MLGIKMLVKKEKAEWKMKKVANDRREVISQPPHAVKTEKDVYVRMRDGVRLAVDVYRSDAAGKFPSLLQMFSKQDIASS